MLWDTTIGAPQEWDVIAGELTCMKMKMDAVVVHPIYVSSDCVIPGQTNTNKICCNLSKYRIISS